LSIVVFCLFTFHSDSTKTTGTIVVVIIW